MTLVPSITSLSSNTLVDSRRESYTLMTGIRIRYVQGPTKLTERALGGYTAHIKWKFALVLQKTIVRKWHVVEVRMKQVCMKL